MTETTTLADMERLLGPGGVSGLGEPELLSRYATLRDEAAFEALVSRHGPMVLSICRRHLRDPHDVEDAFQATFIILARKAATLRRPERLGPWLYGVAVRVARKARRVSGRRAAMIRTSAVEPPCRPEPEDASELFAAIDEEVARLGDRDRSVVVLCGLGERTCAEAAEQLGWPVGTVKSRLSRARRLLCDRLRRRGLDPSIPAILVSRNLPLLPTALGRAAVLAAMSIRLGGPIAAGIGLTGALALCGGWIPMTRMSWLLAVSATATIGFAGAGVLARQEPAPKADTPKVVTPPGVKQDPGLPAAKKRDTPESQAREQLADLIRKRIDRARTRFEATEAFYKEGRLTLDRLCDASDGLMQAEIDAARTMGDRLNAYGSHKDRIRKIADREKEQFLAGRSHEANIAEAEQRLIYAEYLVLKELIAAIGTPSVPRTYLVEDLVTLADSDKIDMNPLVSLLKISVAPGTWNDVPGQVEKPGTIEPFSISKTLIVRHTLDVHEQIEIFLKGLRALPKLKPASPPEVSPIRR